ncbi:MAG: OB-fold domain-containing protein [Gammaproteobacteria bacterium]|nr:OB-fold domain-containing protein [Gammaproteobacteria bacterium]
MSTQSYLPEGMPIPAPESDGLSRPFWEGLREERILVQRCRSCGGWQWGPEWICHRCLSFDLGWEAVDGRGRIYSWERSWHPVHPALRERCPYIAVLVELPAADNVRMLGNLLGDPHQAVQIGQEVEAVFEHHTRQQPHYTLLQWRNV